MQPVPQELLKEYVQSQHFTSTADIMQAMKEMFRDIIQQVMEVEMDDWATRDASIPLQQRKISGRITATAIPIKR